MNATTTGQTARVGTMSWSARTRGQLTGPAARAAASAGSDPRRQRHRQIVDVPAPQLRAVRAAPRPGAACAVVGADPDGGAAGAAAPVPGAAAPLGTAATCSASRWARSNRSTSTGSLLFAAAMLHDIGLTTPTAGVDFTLASARVALDVAETVGLSTAATETMRTAITLHHSPGSPRPPDRSRT